MPATSTASFTVSWIAATTLCIWFNLWIHAPIVLVLVLAAKDYIHSLLYIHLISVYSIYLVCGHNTIFNPSSLNGAVNPLHIWFGRAGIILGVIGFVTLFMLVWYVLDYTQNWGLSIGITYGGVALMQL